MGITSCCGPKLSACCLVISVWGIIQMVLLGVGFYLNSPNLIEDIGIVEEDWLHSNHTTPSQYVEQKYQQTAYNCWIAAAFYVISTIFCSITCYLNSKQVY